jgi:hypothetical protein
MYMPDARRVHREEEESSRSEEWLQIWISA